MVRDTLHANHTTCTQSICQEATDYVMARNHKERPKSAEMAAFHERILWAFFRWQANQRPVRQIKHEELGRLVGKELGRKPVSQPVVSRWFTGTVPERETMVAIARVLGVPVVWLAWGEGEPPSDPAAPTATPRPKS